MRWWQVERTVLVVEDEGLMRAAIADELRAHAYVVVEAPTADDALAIMRSGVEVDLVFTDVRMPGTLDGLALAWLIRTQYPKVKIVITTPMALPKERPTHFLPSPMIWNE
jgi:CheY-like chemotaxis protein